MAPFLVVIELALRIWLKILETMPAEEHAKAWARWAAFLDWLERITPPRP